MADKDMALPAEVSVALLRKLVDADIRQNGEISSTMVRAGLLRDILAHYQALRASAHPPVEES